MRPVPTIKTGDEAGNGGFVGVFVGFHVVFLLKMYCKGPELTLIALNLCNLVVITAIYILNFFLFLTFKLTTMKATSEKNFKKFLIKKFFTYK